ncbi:MAG: ASCH domain-containing protein, partial [Caldimonas sp.]
MHEAPEPGRAAEIEPYWLAYQRACRVSVEGFSASALGHTRSLADTLAELVHSGVKRAHATLLRDFEKDLEPLPRPGDHLVVLDGSGAPRAIVRTTHVEKRHFAEIDDTFAFEAGEGDLTLRWWLTAHRQDYA